MGKKFVESTSQITVIRKSEILHHSFVSQHRLVVISLQHTSMRKAPIGTGSQQRKSLLLSLKTIRSSCNQSSTRGSEGMPQRQRAPQGVHFVHVDVSNGLAAGKT